MDWIELSSFHLDCILGVLDREQYTPQPLEIEIRLGLDLSDAGDNDRLDQTVDYAVVLEWVTAFVLEGRWRLLETMAMGICRLLLSEPAPGEQRPRIDAVEVVLRKPSILGGRAVPGIRMTRSRGLEVPSRSFGKGIVADVLAESPRTSAYRLHIEPGAEFEGSTAWSYRVIAGNIRLNDVRVQNIGDVPASVLAIRR